MYSSHGVKLMNLIETKLDEFKLAGNAGHSDCQIENINCLYLPGMKSLRYDADVKSMSSNGVYKVYLFISKVEPNEVERRGAHWYISDEALLNKDVKVDCSCKQYVLGGCYKGNKAHDCQLYKDHEFDSYERKTDNPNLTKNPNKDPMLCKHLYSFIKFIQDNLTKSSLYK